MIPAIPALLASIAAFVPLPATYDIRVQDCPGYSSWSCVDGNGTVYLSPSALRQGRATAREILAHELGHDVDIQNLNDADRANEARAFGSKGEWFQVFDGSVSMQTPGAEQFADAYALCSLSLKARTRRLHSDQAFVGRGYYLGLSGEALSRKAVAVTCWLIHATA